MLEKSSVETNPKGQSGDDESDNIYYTPLNDSISLERRSEMVGDGLLVPSESAPEVSSEEEEEDNEEEDGGSSGGGRSENDEDVYDWQMEKQRKIQFFDDGTMSYFWRAHTLTVLFIAIGVLVYVALFESVRENSEYNTKRGMAACVFFFILLGVTIIPDGPMIRPHPAFWRLTFCLSILYQLSLIFILFQSANDARQLLRYIDPKLGEALEEKSYGSSCTIYDPDRPDNPFHNVWAKMDLFVPTHFGGWYLKTLILRDWWLCTVISVMFEVLEYTLEHQLPNFSECWWDHWIMDVLLCNGLGIYFGIKTLRYFQVKTYYWRGLWSIPGYRGKIKRIFGQFGPHSWMEFEWKPTSSIGRWVSVLGIISLFLMAELNTFYLKFVLWVPPGHWLNLVRLFAILSWGAVSFRETFQYLDDPDCKTFGRQSWLVLSIVSTEFLIVAKFDSVTITQPLPQHIAFFWLIGLGLLFAYTVWNFELYKLIFLKKGSRNNLLSLRAKNSKSESNAIYTQNHTVVENGTNKLRTLSDSESPTRSQSADRVLLKNSNLVHGSQRKKLSDVAHPS